MRFDAIYVSARSACFESDADTPYLAPHPYDVSVGGKTVLADVGRNVFSLFDLKPGTTYEVVADGCPIRFSTRPETALLDVRDFGAKGDGVEDDTAAIQDAIDRCPAGGTVRLSNGVYRSLPLFLKDGVTVELCEGATLSGRPERNLYPVLPALRAGFSGREALLSGWEGDVKPTCASLVTAIGVKDGAIIGRGSIDCGASRSDWWKNHKLPVDGAYRAKGVYFAQCERMTIHGVSLSDTPSWALHPFFSKDVSYLDMTVTNPPDSPNTDGCDPDSCDGVRLVGMTISVGDDCVAIKSGKYALGMAYRVPCERIVIRNCRMVRGDGAVVLGSEMSGGIRDLEVNHCLFEGTDRGLRIKTRRGRGESGVIDGVRFEKIRMDGVLTPFVMNMYYHCDDDGKTAYVWSKDPLPVDDRTPRLGRFEFCDIDCENAAVAAGFFYGLPERPIGEVVLRRVRVRFAMDAEPGLPAMMSHLEPTKKAGWFFRFVDRVAFEDVELAGEEGPTATLLDVGSASGVPSR